MGYIDNLKLKIANLEHDDAIKESEIQLLLNEREDVLRPSIAMSQMTAIILSMLIDNNKFVQKNGITEKAKESRERLIKLMDLNIEFDNISKQNYTLKHFIKNFHTQNMMLRVQIADLKKEISVYHQTTKEL